MIMMNARQMKSKVAAKGGNIQYQWNILKMLGISDEQVKRSLYISKLF